MALGGVLIGLVATIAVAGDPPSNDQAGFLLLTNEARANPSASGGSESPLPPLIWSDGLGAAAQAHSNDMAANGCFQHNSCGGGSWTQRITSYYPSWEWIGENIGSGLSDPALLTVGWLASAGHRANLLSGAFNEFGAGLGLGQDGFGSFYVATEDFGRRMLISLQMLPTLPAGAVLPRVGGSELRDVAANYYHYGGGAPRSIQAAIGGTCVSLSLRNGTASHGTYAARRSISGSGCVPVAFFATRSDGQTARFPSSGSYLIGVGSGGASCAEKTTANPSASCGSSGGGGPTPTPSPGPTPTPGSGQGLTEGRAVLRSHGGDPGAASARVTAVVPVGGTADPTTSAIQITMTFADGARWSETLPATCGNAPCLIPNGSATTYRARYGTKGPWLSLSRTESGGWRARFTTKTTTLPDLTDGAVSLTIGAFGSSKSATLVGESRPGGFVVE